MKLDDIILTEGELINKAKAKIKSFINSAHQYFKDPREQKAALSDIEQRLIELDRIKHEQPQKYYRELLQLSYDVEDLNKQPLI